MFHQRVSLYVNVLLSTDSTQVGSRLDVPHLDRMISLGLDGLQHLDHAHALQYLPEHHVFAIQVRRGHGGDEELRAVGVGPGVGHAQQALFVMLTKYEKRKKTVLYLILFSRQ